LGKENDILSNGFKKLGAIIIAAFAIDKIKDFAKNVIESTQTTGDKFEMMMGGMEEATNFFYRTIASGDFSNLINGLSDAYEAGAKYAEMLDLLADTQRAVQISTSELDVKLSKLRLESRDKTNSTEDRIAAVNEYKKTAEEKLNIVKTQAEKELAAISDLSTSRTRLSAVALKEIISSVDWQNKIAEGTKIQLELEKKVYDAKATSQGLPDYEGGSNRYEDLYANLTSEERLYVSAAKAYNNLSDEQRNILKEKIVQQNNANLQYINGLQEISRVENGIRSEMSADDKKRFDAKVKADEEKQKADEEAYRLKLELMNDGFAKETDIEYKRYEDYIAKHGESEDAEKLHYQKLSEISQKYRDLEFKRNLETQTEDQKQREWYAKWIEDQAKANDAELLKQEKKSDKDLEKQRKDQQKQQLKYYSDISSAAFDQIEANHRAMMKMLDDEINKQEKNIETQQRLAERGLSNTLSFEQTKLKELEKQKLEAEKKAEQRRKTQEAVEYALAFMKAYRNNLDADMPATQAISMALKDTIMAKLIGQSIGGFFEEGGIAGVDGKKIPTNRYGILQGKRHSQGGILIEAEVGEGYLSRKEVSNMGMANFYNLKRLLKNPVQSTGSNNLDILEGISETNQILKGIPKIVYDIDNLNQMVRTEIRNGIKEVTTFKRKGVN
jgi:hypothetical protein